MAQDVLRVGLGMLTLGSGKAVTAHVQRLKRNQRKKISVLSLWESRIDLFTLF